MKSKLKCWEFFECSEKECPVYESEELKCWLVPGTHCRNEIQGKFLEKMEVCLRCEPFRANMDVDSMEETLDVAGTQFANFRAMVEDRDRELEGISMELALGLSEVFVALKDISSGDPSVRLPEASDSELVRKLKHMVNLTAEELGEIVGLSHEFAIGLAEHFDVLHRVSKGELAARVSGGSQVELLESLKQVTNHMIESVSAEIADRKRAEQALQVRSHDLGERVKDLNCLYTISKLVMRPGISFDKLFQDIVDLIPDSWHHAKIACARIVVESQEFRTENFRETAWKQTSDITMNGKRVGSVEVCYLEQRPEADEGPFFQEDRNLMDAIAERLGKIMEQKQAEEERKKLEASLKRAEKMEVVGTLAGGVAHDLNNILGGLVGYPDLLLMDLPEESPLKKGILTMQESGKKAAAIVQDLLTLARRGVAVTEVTNVNDVTTDYLASPEHERLREFHLRVEFEISLEADVLNIMASPVHLSKTIMNLVSNAAEALPDGGKVIISARNQYVDRPIRGYDEVKEGDYVVLTVADNGIGISSQDTQRIFEPFYTKKTMGRSGTGLGMAVVWGTVKDHSGYIEVRSDVGKGTTFDLYFPVTRKELEKEKAAFSIEDHMGHGEKVVVVDDVEEQREIAAMLLTTLGYSVHAVVSGEEAVEYLKTGSVDLLVLDMIMDPGIDGLDTYKKILESHPGTRAVIASGFSETDRVREAQRLGAGEYVKKPYTLEKIGLAVKAELEK